MSGFRGLGFIAGGVCYALGLFHFRLCGFGIVFLGFRASAGGFSCLWSNVVVAFFLWVCVCVHECKRGCACMHVCSSKL